MSLPSPLLALSAVLAPWLGASPSAGPAPAQDSPAAQEPARAEEQKPARARTHLLHLTDGRVLRMLARSTRPDSTEASWEVRSGSEWVALPSELVLRAVPEADALRDARRLARELAKEADPVRRVAYADWLVNEGLQVEALAELDRVLDEHPGQSDACALLARAALPLALPPLPLEETQDEALDAFLDVVARGRGALQEIALQRLQQAQVPGLAQRLPGELVHRRPARRAFAAQALGRLMPGRHLESLLSRSVLDRDEHVRRAAALALRAADDPSLIRPALRALESSRPEVRLNAVEALGHMHYAAAVAPLVTHLAGLQNSQGAGGAARSHIFVGRQSAYVQDYDVEVASNSAIADPLINIASQGAVLDAAVVGVHEVSLQTERAALRRSLTRLTGAAPGNTASAWLRWWEEHGDEWTAVERSHEGSSSPVDRGR